MNAEGIREIAKMQQQIDRYEFFLGNLLVKLNLPDKDVAMVEACNDTCDWIWSEVDKMQKQIKEHER